MNNEYYVLNTLTDDEWLNDVPDEMCEVYIDICIHKKNYDFDQIEILRNKYPKWWVKVIEKGH